MSKPKVENGQIWVNESINMFSHVYLVRNGFVMYECGTLDGQYLRWNGYLEADFTKHNTLYANADGSPVDGAECILCGRTDDVERLEETISKLKELAEDAYFDGCSDGFNDKGDWCDTEAFKAMEKL